MSVFFNSQGPCDFCDKNIPQEQYHDHMIAHQRTNIIEAIGKKGRHGIHTNDIQLKHAILLSAVTLNAVAQ
jgi:hypothetical protein